MVARDGERVDISALAKQGPGMEPSAQHRAYFLWDTSLTLEQWRERIASGPEADRAWWLAKALREARPEDALDYTTLAEIGALWPHLQHNLGRKHDFWVWLLDRKGIPRAAE